MAKMDVRISDSLLDEIIEYYRKAGPIEFPTVFGIYIALKELKQIRATGLTPEEISTLKARLDAAEECIGFIHGYLQTIQNATDYIKPGTGVWHTVGVALERIAEWRGLSEVINEK